MPLLSELLLAAVTAASGKTKSFQALLPFPSLNVGKRKKSPFTLCCKSCWHACLKSLCLFYFLILLTNPLNGMILFNVNNVLNICPPVRNLDHHLKNYSLFLSQTYGDSAFFVFAHKLWNSLPSQIRNSPFDIFNETFKTFLFKRTFCW